MSLEDELASNSNNAIMSIHYISMGPKGDDGQTSPSQSKVTSTFTHGKYPSAFPVSIHKYSCKYSPANTCDNVRRTAVANQVSRFQSFGRCLMKIPDAFKDKSVKE